MLRSIALLAKTLIWIKTLIAFGFPLEDLEQFKLRMRRSLIVFSSFEVPHAGALVESRLWEWYTGVKVWKRLAIADNEHG